MPRIDCEWYGGHEPGKYCNHCDPDMKRWEADYRARLSRIDRLTLRIGLSRFPWVPFIAAGFGIVVMTALFGAVGAIGWLLGGW